MQTIDISTIYACQRGDQNAFRRIYEAYNQKIYRLIYRYCHDPEESLDLTQEVFVRIYTKIADFRSECSLETWIYQIAINTVTSAMRKSKSHEPLDHHCADIEGQADIHIEMQELGQHIERSISTLPESLRMAFILAVIEGLPYVEVGKILGISVEAVRMRVSRARHLLRESLQPYINEGENP
jgi:RNA polymerase sigma-70 factor (ECF subfamily)